MGADDLHEVFAIAYGKHDRPSAANFIGADPHDTANSPLTYFVWLIAGPHGHFVVDTGFDEDMAKKRERHVSRPIGEGLKALGVDPAKVRNVICTHLHYDHAGNYNLFPAARYHLQDSEMAYATGRCMCHAHQRFPFEADDVTALVRKVFDGRVEFHDGDDEIAPGISVHHLGGHSKGLQGVRVKTRRGHVMLASDASHLYAHVEQGRVFPITYNVADVLEGYRTLRRLASTPAHIVPGHDPLVLSRYPAARAGLEDWIVRLDVEPGI